MQVVSPVDAPFDLRLPTRVFCGCGAVDRLTDYCRDLGPRVLLVTARDLAQAEQAVTRRLIEGNCSVDCFHLDSAEPACDLLDVAARRLRSSPFDVIVGLGGGSAIDAAKALSIALPHREPIWRYANLSNRPPLPLAADPIPVVAVPTTSGTGAELTPYAVLTNEQTGQKGTIQEAAIFPRAAVIDPALASTMPPILTACTGFDALAHALESHLNISKASPVAEWAARESIRLTFGNLPRAFRSPDDLQARLQMCWASALAGIAIAHRGTTAGHAVAEPLGALTHLPHGRCVVLTTGPVLQRTERSAREKLAELYRNTWPEDAAQTDAYCSEGFVRRVADLRSELDLDPCAADLLPGSDTEDLVQRLVDDILRYKFRPLKQHPVELDREALTEIAREVMHG